MALQSNLFPFKKPESCPISFYIDGIPYRGIPESFHPKVKRTQIDASVILYTVTGRHASGLLIRLEAMIYRDFSVTDWIAYFENDTDHASPIVSDIKIINGTIHGNNCILEHNNGDTCTPDGYTITETGMENGASVSLSPFGGTSCCGAGPYMRLSFDSFGVNLAIGFTAGWQADFRGERDGVSLSVGQRRCHMSILPGEVIRTPRVTMQAYAGNTVRGRNAWRQFYFAHILPKENGSPLPPKLCMHVFCDGGPEFTGTTTEHQIKGLHQYIARGMKPDIWWIDAGWYPCNGEWPHTGTWEADLNRFPGTLSEIGQACDDRDVQLLLWFEPERVQKNTWIYDHHPEWLFTNDSVNALFNLGNPAACDWLIDHVDHLIKSFHVRIYRQDFNFSPAEYWEQYEAEDRIGALENLHVQGYLRYWDTLLDRNPGLWIDSCASGGRRNDLDTMRRAVPLHYTDVGYGNHPIKHKQHRLMFEWIPYFRAHNMSWDDENGMYINNASRLVDRFAFHCALAPALTNMTTYDAPEEEYETASVMLPIWRRAAELELRADYYPLTACNADPTQYYAMQFDDPDAGDGFVQIIRYAKTEEEPFLLHMVTHDPDAVYFFENMETGDMMQLTGAQLEEGIPLSLEKRSGAVWFYTIAAL